ncbi:MAG: TetR/AcrR family transcriptional regulator [Steroidobacteraceae bacterium]
MRTSAVGQAKPGESSVCSGSVASYGTIRALTFPDAARVLTRPKTKSAASNVKIRTDSAKPAADAEASSPSAGRRERRMQKSRRHIAEVAVSLFEQKGFSATTVEEIADAADYSTSTFFRLFPDKEEVIFYDFGDRFDELKDFFALPDHGDVWAAVRNMFINYAHRWDVEDGELGQRRARLFHDESLLHARYLAKSKHWEVAMAQLIAADLPKEPNRELFANVIAGAAVSAFAAAWRVRVVDEQRTLAECVTTALDQLESIGAFFHSPPARAGRSKVAARVTKARNKS